MLQVQAMSRKGVGYRRQVLVNTLSTVGSNLWSIALTILTLPLLLRGMGATAFGTWVLLQTFSATTGWLSLADAGVGTSTARSVAAHAAVDEEDQLGSVVASSLSLHLLIGVIAASLLALAGPALLPSLFNTPGHLVGHLRAAVVLYAIQVVLDLLSRGLSSCIEGAQRVDMSRIIDVTRRTGMSVGTATAALAFGDLRSVAAASLWASVITLAVAVVLFRRHVPVRWSRPDPSRATALLRYGVTVAMLNATGVLHRTMDRVIVGAILGPSAVAIVEIATQVQNGAASILSAASYAAISSASWLRARGDHAALRELVLTGTKYATLATVPLSIILMAVAGPLVRTWVGSQYDRAVVPLVLALLYIVSAAPLQVGSNLLQGVGRAGDVLKAATAGVVVNLLVSLVLVRVLGIEGAFIATLAGGAVLIVPLLRSVLREARVDLRTFLVAGVRPALAPSLAGGVVAVAVVVLSPGNALVTLLAAATGSVAAAVAVAIRVSFDAGELRQLQGTLLRR